MVSTAPAGRPPTGARPSDADRRAASEDALLRAAAELVAEHGIERTTLARIGERAGLSRTLPTYLFGSKDVLVERLAERAQDRISAATNRALADAGLQFDQLPAFERLRRTVDAQLSLFESPAPEDRAFVVLWAASFPARSSMAGMRAADRRTHDGWRNLVRSGQEDGSIRDDVDPAAVATWLMGLTRGLAAVLATHPDTSAHREARRTCDRLITDALALDRGPADEGPGRPPGTGGS